MHSSPPARTIKSQLAVEQSSIGGSGINRENIFHVQGQRISHREMVRGARSQ